MALSVRLYAIALTCFLTCGCSSAWRNDWEKEVNFQCPKNEALNRMKSEHSDSKGDRKFDFDCADTGVELEGCEWSGWVADIKVTINYQCPDNGLLTGVYNTFNKDHKDRYWSFRCCKTSNYVPHSCRSSGLTYGWDQKQDVILESGSFMRGITAFYDNGHQDRKYAIFSCKLGQLEPVSTIFG